MKHTQERKKNMMYTYKKIEAQKIQSSDLTLFGWHIVSATEITVAERKVPQTEKRT